MTALALGAFESVQSCFLPVGLLSEQQSQFPLTLHGLRNDFAALGSVVRDCWRPLMSRS